MAMKQADVALPYAETLERLYEKHLDEELECKYYKPNITELVNACNDYNKLYLLYRVAIQLLG